MAANNSTIIKVLRCKEVKASRDIAMLHLMEDVNHIEGQPVITSYYTDESHKTVDTILAMGIKRGRGKDKFSVISSGQLIVVWDVVNELPDISSLVHGEVYLYYGKTNVLDPDEEKKWYTVFSSDGVYRYLTPISENSNKTFINLKDNMIWTSGGLDWMSGTDAIVRPLSGTYTRKEIDDLIRQIEIDTDFDKIKEELRIAIEKSDYAAEKVDELEQRIIDLEQGDAGVRAVEQMHNKVVPVLKKVKINDEWVEREDTRFIKSSDPKTFQAGELKFEITYTNYDGTVFSTHFDDASQLYVTDFQSVTVTIGPEEITSMAVFDEMDGLYSISSSILLDRDIVYPIAFSVKPNDIIVEPEYGEEGEPARITFEEIKGTINLYSVKIPRYSGRVLDPEVIDSLEGLTEDDEYNWENLKRRNNFRFAAGDGYFVILYNKSWGELDEISSAPFLYYSKVYQKTTFKKIEVTIDSVDFYAYVYQNPSKDGAVNINFI